MDDLDQVPETSFEKDIVCEDEEAFCLSRENITSLKLLLCQVRLLYKRSVEKGCEYFTVPFCFLGSKFQNLSSVHHSEWLISGCTPIHCALTKAMWQIMA